MCLAPDEVAVTRARGRLALWIVVVGALLYLGWTARSALVPFAVGGVIAYALLPVVDRLAISIPLRDPKYETVRRGFAVLLVYLAFGAMLWLALALLIPVLADQVTTFIDTLPERIDAARRMSNRWLEEYRTRVPLETQEQLDGYLADAGNAVASAVQDWVERAIRLVTGTVSILFGYLVVPFWMFYAMRDRYAAGRGFKNAVPPVLRDDVSNVFYMLDHLLGRYIRGQLLLGLVVGIVVGIGLSLLGVQLSIGLGVWAGITELVPIVGPWLGAIPAFIVVLSTEPGLLLPVIILYFSVQQLESLFLVPRVQGEALDLPAGMVIVLLVVGGAAFGFAGLVVAVPLAAMLREIFWYTDRRLAGATPAESFAECRAARTGAVESTQGPSRLTTAIRAVGAKLRGSTLR
jgi:predicted PurR-regulated permease PerM